LQITRPANLEYLDRAHADQLREYHPEWDNLSQQDDRTAAENTQPDAFAWVNHAVELAIDKRCHVVVDATMGSVNSVLARIDQFERAGYTIEVRVLAVDRRQSWLGVLRRYEERKAAIGSGRMTPREMHDRAYTGLVDTLERIESTRQEVRIRLYSRDGIVVFDSSQQTTDGPTNAAEALTRERARQWTQAELDEFNQAREGLVALASDRRADATTIEEYRQLQSDP
jgi:UDP-N-acetylglucosamine kinase